MRLAERQALIALGDAVAGFAGAAAASLIWEGLTGRTLAVGRMASLFVAATWVIALLLVHGYAPLVPLSRLYSAASVAKASALVVVAGFLAFSLSPERMSRATVIIAALLGLILIAAWRVTLARLLLRGSFAAPTVLVSAQAINADVEEALVAARNEYQMVEKILGADAEDPERTVVRLKTLLEANRCRELLVGPLPAPVAAAVVDHCVSAGVSIHSLGATLEDYLTRVPIDQVDHEWFLHLPSGRLRDRPSLVLRRLFDLLIVALVSIPLFAITPVVAALIAMESPGPIYYRQQRVGRHGVRFEIVKFRTMRFDAEIDGPRAATARDPRVTRSGRLLRSTHLDELPQIINIWRGDMSLTGPRPVRWEEVEFLAARIPHYRARLLVKPGLTGWGQVKHGYAGTVAAHQRYLEYDLYYVKHRSLRLDLQILILTVFRVLGLRGR